MSTPCWSYVCIHRISVNNLGLFHYLLLLLFDVYISVTVCCKNSSSNTLTIECSPSWIVINSTVNPRDHLHNCGFLRVDFTSGLFHWYLGYDKWPQCQWSDSEACRQINCKNYMELVQNVMCISYAMWCFTLQAICKLDNEQTRE